MKGLKANSKQRAPSRIAEDPGVHIVERGVPIEAQSMPLDKVFWSHFSPNFGPAALLLGLLVAGTGLGLGWGLLAIVAGNVLGGIPVGVCALMGPRTGLTQIEMSRFSFGRLGTRLPAGIFYFSIIGWDAVGNVPAALALAGLLALAGVGAPFWVALALVAVAQIVAGAFGHHVVALLQKYLGYVLLGAFGVVGFLAIRHGDAAAATSQALTFHAFALGTTLAASNALSWAPYSSDYTRYAPRSTSPVRIFALSFLGLALSSIAMEALGLVAAAQIASTSPAALQAGIVSLCGPFAPFALGALVLSAIASNSVNDNTAGYSLISMGVRIARPIAAGLTGLFGYTVAVIGAGSFASLYANYLIVLLYWVSPWIAILVTDWWMRPTEARPVPNWGAGAAVFIVVCPLTIGLFSATDAYTGPIAKALGGIDIGYVVGFFAAGAAYWLLARRAVVDDAASEREAALEPVGAFE